MYGLLLSSVAAGAFIGLDHQRLDSAHPALRTGPSSVSRAWGAAIAVAGLVRVPVLVMLALLFAGAADMISGVYRPRSRPPLRPTTYAVA